MNKKNIVSNKKTTHMNSVVKIDITKDKKDMKDYKLCWFCSTRCKEFISICKSCEEELQEKREKKRKVLYRLNINDF